LTDILHNFKQFVVFLDYNVQKSLPQNIAQKFLQTIASGEKQFHRQKGTEPLGNTSKPIGAQI